MRSVSRALSLLVVLAGLFAAPATPAAAATRPILYVDGKIGFDSVPGVAWSTDWGLTPGRPFKTVERALDETRHGSPTAIRIKGYDDYTYQESISRGYRMGSSTTPVTIGSYTRDEIPTGPIVRPILDGGLNVGTTGWRRPWTAYPNVWCKTWMPPSGNLVTGQKVPPGYDTQYDATHEDRLYLDGSQPLHRPASVPSIAQLNSQPYSQYWDRTKSTDNLCVHLGMWSGAAIDKNPATHTITVPWYHGLNLAGGSSYVTIDSLRIRHTVMGVGISVSADKAIGKSHHVTVRNTDASYNYRMGFWTAGDDNVFDKISGSRNTIQLIKLDVGTYSDGTAYGAQHNVIRSSISTQNLGHGIKLSGKQVAWNHGYDNTIDGTGIPKVAKSAGGATQAIQVANGAGGNAFWRNRIRGTDAGIELYQYDTNGGPLVGNSFHHNRLEGVGTGVFLWDAKVSSAYGTGANAFSYNVYVDNQTAIGGNGTTSGKTFDHETIRHSGFRVNTTAPSIESAAVALMAGSITIRNTIIDDSNGPAICPRSGTTVTLSYTDVYRWKADPRASMPHGAFCASTSQHAFGTVKVGAGVTYLDPAYSTDPPSSSFLVVTPSSPLYTKASDGSRLGAL
jgi:Right handed beta helix region